MRKLEILQFCKKMFSHFFFFRMHYLEYLCILIRKYNIETISILNADDLETVVRRAAKKLPPNCFGTPREMYRQRLKQVEYQNGFVAFNY